MKSRAIEMLEESRLGGIMDRMEAGEPVDFRKEAALQAAGIARAGQLFAADALRREDEADEEFDRQLGSG